MAGPFCNQNIGRWRRRRGNAECVALSPSPWRWWRRRGNAECVADPKAEFFAFFFSIVIHDE
jgi:hypothetical protein